MYIVCGAPSGRVCKLWHLGRREPFLQAFAFWKDEVYYLGVWSTPKGKCRCGQEILYLLCMSLDSYAVLTIKWSCAIFRRGEISDKSPVCRCLLVITRRSSLSTQRRMCFKMGRLIRFSFNRNEPSTSVVNKERKIQCNLLYTHTHTHTHIYIYTYIYIYIYI